MLNRTNVGSIGIPIDRRGQSKQNSKMNHNLNTTALLVGGSAALAGLWRIWRLQNHIGVYTIGDGKSNAERVVRHVLVSRFDVHKSPVEVKFQLDCTDQTGLKIKRLPFNAPTDIVLCWVDPEGGLHHFYNFRGEHLEQSWIGDSFVLFSVPKEKPTTSSCGSSFYLKCGGKFPNKPKRVLPKHVDQLSGREADLAGMYLLCSYRITRGHPRHRVTLNAKLDSNGEFYVDSITANREGPSYGSDSDTDSGSDSENGNADDEYRFLI